MAKLKRVFCTNCKKPIYRSNGRINENLKLGHNFYCSRKCEYKYKTTRKKLNCENCGKSFLRQPSDFSPHNYCSQSCAAVINNKKCPKRRAKLKVCANTECNKQFKGRSKYCSKQCKLDVLRTYSRRELIEIIKRTAWELKRVPAKRELKTIARACETSFGSWNNAVIAAGLQPNRSHSQRMYKRTNTVALDGHLCDSISELLIDNWLTKNNISHERDAHYPGTHHKADWEISIGSKKIFVEYFGLANDSPRYDRSIREKEILCKKQNISLIAIYPKDLYPKIYLENNLKNKFRDYLLI